MFHFVNQKIDLLVTPNHLMVDDSKSTRRFIQASANVRWSHLRVPVSGVWPDSNTEKDHVLPEASATEHAMYPQPEEVPYKGNVYCVDLPPNRTLYVRRNGKVCLGSNCYDEGKRCAETICWEFRKSGVDVRVARIFNTYGPRMHPDDGRVISNFVRQAIQGLPLTVYGNGSQTRSFCYVSDLVRGLRMLAEIKTPPTTPVNIGNDCEFKISELAEALTEWFLRIDILNEPLPKDDPKVRKPDLTLARNLLGYKPTVSLREGLVHTIAWMKEKL
jgi:UDP-glucuronate decarboxylase